MQGDLISRSALIEAIDKMEKGNFYLPLLFRDMVKLQPTAYDVEKVIEQLDDVLYDYTTGAEYYVAGDKMEQIVRNGGKE